MPLYPLILTAGWATSPQPASDPANERNSISLCSVSSAGRTIHALHKYLGRRSKLSHLLPPANHPPLPPRHYPDPACITPTPTMTMTIADPVADTVPDDSLIAGNAEPSGAVLVQVLVETSTVISGSGPLSDSTVSTPMTTPAATTTAEAAPALPSEIASGAVVLEQLSSEESDEDENLGWIPKGGTTPNARGKTKTTVPAVPTPRPSTTSGGAAASTQSSNPSKTTKTNTTKTPQSQRN
ncbi:hypothetical protein ACG7TL_000432 [Trametes sanguinea]